MTNFEKALEIINRVGDDNRTLLLNLRNSLALATVDEKSREYFRGETFILYATERITAEERDILRVATYEAIPENLEGV